MKEAVQQPQAWRFNVFFEKDNKRIFLLPTIALEEDRDAELYLYHLTLMFLCYHQTFTLSK